MVALATRWVRLVRPVYDLTAIRSAGRRPGCGCRNFRFWLPRSLTARPRCGLVGVWPSAPTLKSRWSVIQADWAVLTGAVG